MVLSNGVWCRNKVLVAGLHRCRKCLDDEAKRAEKTREREAQIEAARIELEARRKREREEDAALRAEPWFPALERMLEERAVELQRNIEEWANDTFESTPYDGW